MVKPAHGAFEEFLKRLHEDPSYWQRLSDRERLDWADVGAAYLVIKIENPTGTQKKSVWGFWSRVKHAEKAALHVVELLIDQSFALRSYVLHVFWTKVRASLREGRYHG